MADEAKEFVITDAAGHDHVFPVGVTPEDAVAALHQTNMSRGLSATGQPIAGMDLDKEFSKGFHEHFKQGAPGAKQDSTAGFALGLAEGAPAGVVKGAKATLMLPIAITKAVLGGAADLITDPAGTYEKIKKTAGDLPENVHQAFEAAIKLRTEDPEAWGKQVGELTGSLAGGKIAGSTVAAVKQPVARGVGAAMVKAAEHPLATRLTGGGMLGRAVMTGDPMLGAGGVALMGAPAALRTGGRALQRMGGMDLSENLPSGARSIDVGEASKIKSVGVQDRPNQGTTRVPYSGQAPAPYRSAAKAAVKADTAAANVSSAESNPPIMVGGKQVTAESNPELYKKLKDMGVLTKSIPPAESGGTGLAIGRTASEGAKEATAAPQGRRFMADGQPYTPSDLSAAGPMGARARQGLSDAGFDLKPGENIADAVVSQEGVTAPRTAVPMGKNARPGVSAGQVPEVLGEQTPPAAVANATVTPPPVRPAGTRVGGPALSAPPATPIVPTAPAAPAVGPVQGSIRVGGKPGGVFAPKPIKSVPALEALWQQHGAEEAGTMFAKKNPGAFGQLPKTTRTNLVREAMTAAGTPDAGGLLPETAQAEIDKRIAKLTTDTAKRAYLLKAPNSAAFNYIWKMLKRGTAV